MFNNYVRPVLSLDEVHRLAPSVFAQQPHHEVSSEYRFIPTIDMLRTLMGQGWQPVQAGEHKVRTASKKGYQKHLVRLRHPELPRLGDSEVDLLIYNSHDRTSAFRFLAGMYRFVCANGMAVGECLVEPISVRHIGYRAENAIEASYRIVQNVPKIAASVDEMRQVELEADERLAFAEAALVAKYGKDENGKVQSPIPADYLLRARRMDDTPKDLWTTFNVVQENSLRGGQRGWRTGRDGRVRRASSRSVESVSSSTKLNQALWTLAEQMKNLKTGKAA